jgi:glutamate synthase domain-containing protein 2
MAAAVVAVGLAALSSAWWWVLAALSLATVGVGLCDLVQRQHSIRRNYPVIGRLRWAMEAIRPEVQQYFVERDTDGVPYDRDTRSLVYERAKDTHEEQPFGTELDVYAEGYEWFEHSVVPCPVAAEHRVRVGGSDCTQPYDMSLLNVSAMSFGALSANAILALNRGAALGGFAHDTGEGGLSRYHLEGGGDLVWEIGSGYFGCRTAEGRFDPVVFGDKAQHPKVKAVSIKLSQGAKPGLGGVMPSAKVTPEIAEIRGVLAGRKCVSPPAHSAFGTPAELVEFIGRLRGLSGGKPVGFKLCVGRRSDFLAVCKAILQVGTGPDFVIVDGSEGGTGAAPLEFEDHVGTPLTEGLIFVHNALVGAGLRDSIRVGCSGKIATGFSIVARLAQGADYTNAARAMMFALGCIQAQRCHTNTCPVGVATQDPRRARALVVEDKAARVHNFHRHTVAAANELIAAVGLDDPAQLRPALLHRRISPTTTRTYAELYDYLEPGELLDQPPAAWATDWAAADPAGFRR